MKSRFNYKHIVVVFPTICCLVLVLFYTCQQEEREKEADGNTIGYVPVAFSLSASTKTAYDGEQAFFQDGDRIGIYAVLRKEGESGALQPYGNHADNLPFRYVASENRFVAENENIYLHRGGVLHFYAYYPYREVVLDALSLPHTVGIRQDNGQEYEESDLLMAVVKGYDNTAVPVSLPFTHRMAQLEVNIPKTEVEIESLRMKNRRNQSRVNLSTGRVTIEGNPETALIFRKYQETEERYSFRLLLPPQVIQGGEELFTVELKNGKTKSYLNSSQQVELQPGKITRYDLVLQSRITLVSGEGGTAQTMQEPVTGGNVYPDGELVTVQAFPFYGYVFSGWEENGNKVSESNPYSFMISGNKTLYALFKRSLSEITTSLESLNGGHPRLGLHQARISGGGTLVSGTEEWLEVFPGEGFEFVRWEDGSTENPRLITVGESSDYKAFIQRKTYSVYAYLASGRGSVTFDNGNSVLFGDNISMTAVPSNGQRFLYWENGSTGARRHLYDVRQTWNVRAFFELAPLTYCINCYIDNPQFGTVEGIGCGKINGTHMLYARPKPGYYSSWTQKLVTVQNGDVNVSIRFYE